MSERPSFRREMARPRQRSAAPMLAVLFLATALAIGLQWQRPPPGATGFLVTVDGDVPRPGTHLVDELTVAAAVTAAGGDASGLGATPVPEGFRVHVADGVATVHEPSEPLLVGLPLDVNAAAVHQLMAIPGLGPSAAGAIVAHREAHGPFPNLDALAAVDGLGPKSIDPLRAFLVVPNPVFPEPPGPVDINHATAAELERLPGIGPVMAARIVVDRAERGPFPSVASLQRVDGIGPATVGALAEHAVATP